MFDIHQQIENWMAAAIMGGLSKEEQETFEHHLTECPSCQKLYQEEKMLATMLKKNLSADRPTGNFEDRMVAKFRTALAKHESRFQRFLNLFLQLRQLRYVSLVVTTVVLVLLIQLGSTLTGERRTFPHAKEILTTLNSVYSPTKKDEVLLISREQEWETKQHNEGPRADGYISKAHGLSSTSALSAQAAPGNYPAEFSDNAMIDELQEIQEKPKALAALSTSPTQQEKLSAKFEPVVKGEEAEKRLETLGDQDSKDISTTTQEGNHPLPSTGVPDNRKLIRDAHFEFAVQNFESALERIRTIVGEEEGFVATTNSARLPNGKIRGQVVVKVLPTHLDRLLLKLRALGDLKNQSLTTQDVTKAYFDTAARLRNAKRMEERLLEMLDKAKGKVTDLLVVEKELARVREQIEQMQGELKLYDSLIQYSTVTIILYEKDINQPAAFILKEKANLTLFSPDVEKTFLKARHETEIAKGQILQSKLNRDSSGRTSAIFRILVAPESSDALLTNLKKMGHVQSLTWQSERIAQDGSGVSDTARVEREKVEINLTIVHDDESRKQVNMVLVSKTVEDVLEKAKTEAVTQGVEILASSLERSPTGHANARFSVRVPAKTYGTFLNYLKGLGRVSQFTIQRDDRTTQGKESDDSPVLISLILIDQETVLQQTNLSILTDAVEAKVARVKELTRGLSAEIQTSTFERMPDGGEFADFVFRLPMNQYPAFVEQLKGLGKVKNFTVKRQDRPYETKNDGEAPAEVTLRLYSNSRIVAEDTGLLVTIRTTLSQGFKSLMWSLRMIGVAIAFLAPWAITITLIVWAGIRLWHRGKS